VPRRERLRFAYRSRDGAETRREVEPHSLVNLGRRWYLVAWDRRREDWRSFRIDRLERPVPAGALQPAGAPALTRRIRT
jgi:predicted DNA-binding transcriptional regulator YafY